MKRGRTLPTMVGIVLGLAGSYMAYKAYREAKETCPPFRKRVYSDASELVEAFAEFWHHPEHLRALRASRQIDHPLAEKLMLAVTSVNGSRSSSHAHARYAVRQGLSQQEVEALLRGDVEQVTPQEAPAVSFAQHYAERRDQPDREAVGRLVDAYGSQGARDIVTFVRLITLGNLVGNTFDALISRLLGQPSPDSTLGGELSTAAVFLFGIVPLVPLVVLRSGRAPSG